MEPSNGLNLTEKGYTPTHYGVSTSSLSDVVGGTQSLHDMRVYVFLDG